MLERRSCRETKSRRKLDRLEGFGGRSCRETRSGWKMGRGSCRETRSGWKMEPLIRVVAEKLDLDRK